MSQAELLDWNHLEELKLVLEDEYVVLLQTFLDDSAVRIGEARGALEAGDPPSLREAVHSLKGACGNIGAASLATLCQGIEDQARAGTIGAVGPDLERVAVELERVRGALRSELDAFRTAP